MEKEKISGKSVFVTVGTTEFDKLIKSVTKPEIIQRLKSRGYTEMLLQIGRGQFEPDPDSSPPDFPIKYYRFKPSILEDIKQAALVISHAGAGSCLEVLEAGKPLLVVINDDLMGNHQMELAYQLYSDQHLFYCNCSTLSDTLDTVDFRELKKFPASQPEKFGAGSCLEVLAAGKPLLVVINDDLMGNHQMELAYQLYSDQHLFYCNCSTLSDTLDTVDFHELKKFPASQPEKFGEFMDKVCGFS